MGEHHDHEHHDRIMSIMTMTNMTTRIMVTIMEMVKTRMFLVIKMVIIEFSQKMDERKDLKWAQHSTGTKMPPRIVKDEAKIHFSFVTYQALTLFQYFSLFLFFFSLIYPFHITLTSQAFLIILAILFFLNVIIMIIPMVRGSPEQKGDRKGHPRSWKSCGRYLIDWFFCLVLESQLGPAQCAHTWIKWILNCTNSQNGYMAQLVFSNLLPLASELEA